MRSCRSHVGIAKAPEHTQVIIVGLLAMEELVRAGIIARPTGTTVERVGGRGESLGPERRGYVGVEKNGTKAVVESAKHALSTAVLL